MSLTRLDLTGPTRRPLGHRERIDWHYHDVHQLCHPIHGVLRVSTDRGLWVVPPSRAVWLPATVAHAHRAHGPTEMRTLSFPVEVDPLQTDRPTVLAVSPLLREVIITLSGDDVLPDRHRHNLEQVALDQLHHVEPLALGLPLPRDPRLRDVADILLEDPGDRRTLAELGRAVGAAERTLSRLFRTETGMSFPQWRGQLRLQHSLTLLTTGHQVTAVASACGFHTPSAFVEAFRLAFGTTPGRYQRGLQAPLYR